MLHVVPWALQLITRAMMCGILNGIGDLFSQLFVENTQLNAQRTATFTALVGALGKEGWHLPACVCWVTGTGQAHGIVLA